MKQIEVDDLVFKRRGGFVLGPLSATFLASRCSALIGPSGCGKTTLLRCLAGLERIDSGTIKFDDRLVSGVGKMLAPNHRRIGFLFQDAALWPHLTVREHLQFVEPTLKHGAELELLDQVGLQHLAGRRPGELSGGEGQRLALARALAGGPEILLLDEPLRSLDVPLRAELALLVRSIAEQRGLNLIVVTHDRSEALALADDLIVMRAGRVVECGRSADLLRSPATSYTAAFLCGATCLPVKRSRQHGVETVFGNFPDRDLPPGELQLILLPGSVGIATAVTEKTPIARVWHVRPCLQGVAVTVDLAGKPLELLLPGETCDLSEVALALLGSPRFLLSEEGPS